MATTTTQAHVAATFQKLNFTVASSETAGTTKIGVLPKGAIVTRSWFVVNTIAAGAGNISIATDATANYFQTAAAFGGAPWSTTGTKATATNDADGTVANIDDASATSTAVVVTTTGTLTALDIDVYLEYVLA